MEIELESSCKNKAKNGLYKEIKNFLDENIQLDLPGLVWNDKFHSHDPTMYVVGTKFEPYFSSSHIRLSFIEDVVEVPYIG